MPSRRKWVCTKCGKGKLGPGRPRRNDIVRWCLKCSEAAGVLVPRVVPAMEAKRTASKVRSAAKSTTKRRKVRRLVTAMKAKRPVSMRDGFKIGKTTAGALRRKVIRIVLREYPETRGKLMAAALRRCYMIHQPTWGGRGLASARGIKMGITGEWHYDELLFIHELCHVACETAVPGTGHGSMFQSMLKTIAAEHFKLTAADISQAMKEYRTRQDGTIARRKKYTLDWALTRFMRAKHG